MFYVFLSRGTLKFTAVAVGMLEESFILVLATDKRKSSPPLSKI